MWRIGSQTPPSRMMMPWDVPPACVGAGSTMGVGAGDGVAATAGVPASAATASAAGTARSILRGTAAWRVEVMSQQSFLDGSVGGIADANL
jgi:hypothetical protein